MTHNIVQAILEIMNDEFSWNKIEYEPEEILEIVETLNNFGVLYRVNDENRRQLITKSKIYELKIKAFFALNIIAGDLCWKGVRETSILLRKLAADGIKYVIAKGPAYAFQTYSGTRKVARQFDDLDMWILPEDINKTINIMNESGFEALDERPNGHRLRLENRISSYSHLLTYGNGKSISIELHQAKFDGLNFREIIHGAVNDNELDIYITNPIDTFIQACKHLFVHSDLSLNYWFVDDVWTHCYPFKTLLDVKDTYQYLKKKYNDADERIVQRALTVNGCFFIEFAMSAIQTLWPNFKIEDVLINNNKYVSQHTFSIQNRTYTLLDIIFNQKCLGEKELKLFCKNAAHNQVKIKVKRCSFNELIDRNSADYTFISTEQESGFYWPHHVDERYGKLPTPIKCEITLGWSDCGLGMKCALSRVDSIALDKKCLSRSYSYINVSFILNNELRTVNLLATDRTNSLMFENKKLIFWDMVFWKELKIDFPDLLINFNIDINIVLNTPEYEIQHISLCGPLPVHKRSIEQYADIKSTLAQIELIP